MKELKVFQNEMFGEIRIELIDGKELFCASDIAKALGYVRPADAITQHCKSTVKHSIVTSQGNSIEMNFIPEGDVYRLIVKSKLPAAEKFEKWLFDEILPTIRKSGGVVTNEDLFVNTYFQFADETTKAVLKNMLETNRKQNELILKQQKENSQLTVSLEKQTDETERKVKAIEVLTGKYDVKILQLIARDYINFQVKRTGRSHQDCWSTIYKLTANALEIDLEAQLNVFKQKQKNIVKNNQQLNRQYQLKGIDAKRPNTLEDSLFGITKLSFICSVLNRADVLLEVMAKVFETDLAELIQKYQFIEQEQRLSQLILD